MSEKTLLIASLLQYAERYPGYVFCAFCGAFVENVQEHLDGGVCYRRSDMNPWVIEAWTVVAGLLVREHLEGKR